jgi:TonB family protein
LAPTSGTQLTNSGPKEQPAQLVTQTKPSPVVVEKKEQPQKTGAAVDTKKAEQEASAKRTNSAVSNAFAKADAKNNANNLKGDEGKSGSPNGKTNSAGAATSTSSKVGVSGSLGGGWSLPRYSTAISTAKTGSIVVEFVVHPDGSVSDVKVVGGQAPVGSDTSVQSQVINIIKQNKPTRTKGDAVDRDYTARVTFTFK